MISLISLRGVSTGHFLPGVGVNVTKNTCRGCRVNDISLSQGQYRLIREEEGRLISGNKIWGSHRLEDLVYPLWGVMSLKVIIRVAGLKDSL